MKASKLDKALPKIAAQLKQPPGVYRLPDLTELLQSKREEWDLPQSLSVKKVISGILEKTELRRVVLPSEDYKEVSRFIWGEPSPYSVALSMKEGSYLTHASAVFLHGLNEQIPRTIYVNKEQSKKPASTTPLSQEGIDRTFGNKQRESKYIYNFRDSRIVILSGKNTGALEVSEITGPQGERLQVTKIQRTLIDITVRPTYGGGVFQVLEAFKGAKDRVPVNSIIAVLKQLGYVYPYHQAIGFYMSRAGWPSEQLEKLKKLGLAFDFYLDYAIPASQRQYDKEWRLFFPKGL